MILTTDQKVGGSSLSGCAGSPLRCVGPWSRGCANIASQTATLPVPGPELDLCGVEVAVDEHTGSGVGPSEGSGGGEGPVASGLGGAFSSVRVAGSRFLVCPFVADEPADVIECGVSEMPARMTLARWLLITVQRAGQGNRHCFGDDQQTANKCLDYVPVGATHVEVVFLPGK